MVTLDRQPRLAEAESSGGLAVATVTGAGGRQPCARSGTRSTKTAAVRERRGKPESILQPG